MYRIIAICCGIVCCATPGQAAAVDAPLLSSRYSTFTFDRPPCISDNPSGDPTLGRLACPGLAGYRVKASSSHVVFNPIVYERQPGHRRPKPTPDEPPSHLAFVGILGPRLEWRGVRTSRGFKPYATVLRVRVDFQFYETANELQEVKDPLADVLMVTRLEPDGTSCEVAYVGIAGNPDPNGLARKAADLARTTPCDGIKAKIIGNRSRLLDMIDRQRE